LETNVKEILTSIGYRLRDVGREFRTKPLYRDSDSDNVLSIKKDTGYWYDFKTNQHGSFDKLIKITLNLDDAKAEEYLKNRNWQYESSGIEKEKLEELKVFPSELLDKLEKDHSYWLTRNINEETVSVFEGGVAKEGRMKDRYVLPIFNSKKQIVGFTGRDLTGTKKAKWKHLGDKSKWVYPLYFNKKEVLNAKSVILVESVGDMLSLWQSGVKNSAVTFGLDINNSLLNLFIRMDLDTIYISFNNDENQAGNQAAKKLYFKLLKFFDKNQIKVALPTKNDFGEMNKEEIQQWLKAKNIYPPQE
jgi:5S rRNA maturation endonuclease (ribonuclease M5)